MKIIIIHGDDTEKSFARLKKFIDVAKERSWDITYIDGSIRDIKECLSSSSLFGSEQFFILKDVRSLKKGDFIWINKNESKISGNLIIYSEIPMLVTLLKKFPSDVKIEEYKLPVLIWQFLDNLIPGKSQYSIRLLHKILEKQKPEFIFTLIARHFRDLYLVSIASKTTKFPFWKLNKLKNQASKFSANRIKNFINLLSDIDIKVKTSKVSLTDELDLLIIKQLE